MEDKEIYVLYRTQAFSEAEVVWVGLDKKEAMQRLYVALPNGGYSIQVWKNGKMVNQYYKVKQTLTFVEEE